MALLCPRPQEVQVERARYLRLAEREGRFKQTFQQLNGRA